MLQLYFYPMACSLSSRIALMEAGIEARYRPAHIWKKTVLDDNSNFLAVSSKGAVPVLVLENGERLTEAAAVLQYIADLRPETRLAPPPGDLDRYRLQEWLSFVGTEIHKAFLFPTFWYKDDASKASARERIGQSISVAAAHLSNRDYLVGDRGRPSHLVAAAARPRRRRSRPMAPACRLSRPHAGAPAGQGSDRNRDGVAQDGRCVTARHPPE
jgi:glutathione S-transferase